MIAPSSFLTTVIPSVPGKLSNAASGGAVDVPSHTAVDVDPLLFAGAIEGEGRSGGKVFLTEGLDEPSWLTGWSGIMEGELYLFCRVGLGCDGY